MRTANHRRRTRKLVARNMNFIIRTYNNKLKFQNEVYEKSLYYLCKVMVLSMGKCQKELKDGSCEYCNSKASQKDHNEIMTECNFAHYVELGIQLKKNNIVLFDNGITIKRNQKLYNGEIARMEEQSFGKFVNNAIKKLIDENK